MNKKKSVIFISAGVLAILCFFPLGGGEGGGNGEFWFFIACTIFYTRNEHFLK